MSLNQILNVGDYPEWVDDLLEDYNITLNTTDIINYIARCNYSTNISNVYCTLVFNAVQDLIKADYPNVCVGRYINNMDTHFIINDTNYTYKSDIDEACIEYEKDYEYHC